MNRRLETLISTGLRGRLLRQSLRFTARELTGSSAVCTYSVRETGVRIVLQHRTPDVLVLDEIFYQRLYEPPAEVSELLPSATRALDAGGNIGMFGVWLLGRRPECELISFEPDPRNAELLSRAIAANEAEQRWRLQRSAVAVAAGEVRFAADQFAMSHVVESGNDGASEAESSGGEAPGRTTTVPAVDFFAVAEDVHLAKIDIEGSEWAILADPRMKQLATPALVLEYHPEHCPEPNSHRAAARLLDDAGYVTRTIFQAPSGVGMLWAWRAAQARA